MSIKRTVVLLLVCLLAPAASDARSRKKARQTDNSFSYYLLSLSYAPDFCAQPTGKKDPRECGAGGHMGFVVHGLWPQAESGPGPENCESGEPLSQDVVRATLDYIPSESLIQHEWTTHGTCTGLTPANYFTIVRRARDLVKIPNELKAPSRQLQLDPRDIEAKFAEANPSFPKAAFRMSCYRGTELQEVRIALNKDLSPRAYGSGGGSCGRTILIRPVR